MVLWPRIRNPALFFGLLALFMVGSAYGQQGTGGVTGTVTDPTDARVMGATVAISNVATGVQKTTQTNGAGIYRFDFADIGIYNLKISAKGFADYEWDGFEVTVGQLVNHNVTLELGKTGTVVTVEAEGVQMVNTANAGISSLVNQTTIQNLPLEVRDATVFVNLVPGSVPNSFNASQRGASINGMRGGMGNFMLDGTDNNDYGGGGNGKDLAGAIPGAEVAVSPDAVQEFRVLTNDFSVEYGRSGAFVTDLVTKSGTNQPHGSLFEYNRNSTTTANDFFSNAAGAHDKVIRNQFGGSISGPIKKDMMFIFGAVEWQRLRLSTPYKAFTFTQNFMEFVDSGAFANFLNNNFGAGLDCSSPSNPGCSLGPIFKQLQSKYHIPMATSAFTNVSSSPIFGGTAYDVPMYGQVTYSQRYSLNQFRPDIRFDYDISSQDVLSVHYNMDKYPVTYQAGGGDAVSPGIPGIEQNRAQNAGMSWTRTISPTMVNEAKVGYLRSYANSPCTDCQVSSIVTVDALEFAFGSSQNLPRLFVENTFQYQDRLSIIHGKHTIKAGAEYRRTRNGSSFDANANGFYHMWDMEDLLTDGAVGDAPGIGVGLYHS